MGLAPIRQHLGSLWTESGGGGGEEETGGSIGCSDGVEIESRDDEERKRRDRGGYRDLNYYFLPEEKRKGLRNTDSGTECAGGGEKLQTTPKVHSPWVPSTHIWLVLLRHPSVQTTCSGSYWCTVVCTLVRLCKEVLQRPRLRRTTASWKLVFGQSFRFSSQECAQSQRDCQPQREGERGREGGRGGGGQNKKRRGGGSAV
uniref:Uncharacterized protein n=1 Tax=Cyclopterus lumpus TaxID=8103 RepID=A0A8C2XSN4_CYCLU